MKEKMHVIKAVQTIGTRLMFLSLIAMMVALCVEGCYAIDYSVRVTITTVSALSVAISIFGALCEAAMHDEYCKSLPEALASPIESDHGNDMSTVMESIRNEPVEYIALFDSTGNKLIEVTTLSYDSCRIPSERVKKVEGQRTVEVHNHPIVTPKSATLWHESFSGADIGGMIFRNSQRSIVVTRDYTYTLDNPRWSKNSEINGWETVRVFFNTIVMYNFWLCIGLAKSAKDCTHFAAQHVARSLDFNYHAEPRH